MRPKPGRCWPAWHRSAERAAAGAGFLTGNKMLYEVLAAYRQVQPTAPQLRLVFAGEERPAEYDLSARIAAWWPAGDGPAVTGYLDAALDTLLARADLSFVLRYPTYGESSGILPRAALGGARGDGGHRRPEFASPRVTPLNVGPGLVDDLARAMAEVARAAPWGPEDRRSPSGRRGTTPGRPDARGPLPGLAGLAECVTRGAAMSRPTVRRWPGTCPVGSTPGWRSLASAGAPRWCWPRRNAVGGLCWKAWPRCSGCIRPRTPARLPCSAGLSSGPAPSSGPDRADQAADATRIAARADLRVLGVTDEPGRGQLLAPGWRQVPGRPCSGAGVLERLGRL
jgi:hypothetical protein